MKTKIIGAVVAAILIVGIGFTYVTLHKGLLSSKAEIGNLRSQVTESNSKVEKLSAQLNQQPQPVQPDSTKEPTDRKTTTQDLIPILKDLDLRQFQAVHLADGSVYFGKITTYNTDFLVLEDIFYMQGGYTDPSKPQTGTAQPAISLVKRGSELHGPEDSMTINIVNVLFVETLKSDSKVLQAIVQYNNYSH